IPRRTGALFFPPPLDLPDELLSRLLLQAPTAGPPRRTAPARNPPFFRASRRVNVRPGCSSMVLPLGGVTVGGRPCHAGRRVSTNPDPALTPGPPAASPRPGPRRRGWPRRPC